MSRLFLICTLAVYFVALVAQASDRDREDALMTSEKDAASFLQRQKRGDSDGFSPHMQQDHKVDEAVITEMRQDAQNGKTPDFAKNDA